MVKMTNVWDRTTAFLSEHGRPVAIVAAGLVFAPNVLSGMFDGSSGVATGAGPGMMAALVLFQFLLAIVMLLGGSAITALAIRPSTPGHAIGHAARRLPALIGVSIVLLLGLVVLLIPFIAIIGGRDLAALSAPEPTLPDIAPGTVLALFGYGVLLFAAMAWLGARLIVIGAVILAERRGLGAITRSWELTRGHTWRIIGLLLLYMLVAVFAMMAIGAAVGAVALLALGTESLVGRLIIAVGAGIVATLLTVAQSAFVGKLYTMLAPAPELEETFA